jgi:chemotaxis protein CheC
MMDIRELQELQLDALREVANIGAGHAATALSQLTNSRIMVEVPRLQIARVEEVPELVGTGDEVVAAVLMHMLGDLSGRTLLILPWSTALGLAEILLNRPRGTLTELDTMGQSAVKEAGNILSAAYMNALSDFMGMMLLPSVPHLVVDYCAAVLSTVYSDMVADTDHALSIETRFTMSGTAVVSGHFLLLPGEGSLESILRTIRVA